MSSAVQSLSEPKVPLVDLSAQHVNLRHEMQQAIRAVVSSGQFILGEALERFEDAFAKFCGARYGIGVDSGMSALELILEAHGVGRGDEVITAANSFVASAFSISNVDATPVFVDVNRKTGNIDVSKLEAAVTPRTRAIMPVHLYGQPADMDPIVRVAERNGLIVIEDACQAHGSRYKGRRAGSLGHAAAFSFYPGKNLGCLGDGGMVVTDDAFLASQIRLLRNYGQLKKYQHVRIGHNKRLDTIQAAVLEVKLGRLEEWNRQRRRRAQRYRELLDGSAVGLPYCEPFAEHVWHLFVIECEERDALAAHLQTHGVETGIHYPAPIHLQGAYRSHGYSRGDFPVSEARARRVLSLPMYPELTPQIQDRVVQHILEFQQRSVQAA